MDLDCRQRLRMFWTVYRSDGSLGSLMPKHCLALSLNLSRVGAEARVRVVLRGNIKILQHGITLLHSSPATVFVQNETGA